jgi:two-component sensor histidine kinase
MATAFIGAAIALPPAHARADRDRVNELERSLAEKTTLLKEVHHRVKNNLQVVCSLLSMQIGCADSELVSGPLNDAYSRVLAMSLIHERIYQSETLSDVNFGGYIEALAERLFDAYCVDPVRIRLETSLEPVPIVLDQAVPCGLILNELISNALKHAFPAGRKGIIRISLRRAAHNRVVLTIADNGIGLPPDFRWENSGSLGLQVVHTLTDQLHAVLNVVDQDGTAYSLNWKIG